MPVHIQTAKTNEEKPNSAGMPIQDDLFNEIIVPQRWGKMDYLKLAGIGLALVLLSILMAFFFRYIYMFIVFLMVGMCVGAYYLITSLFKEHEYIATNGILDIDCIIARRKRKRIFSISGRDMEHIGPVDDAEYRSLSQKRYKVLECQSRREDAKLWYLTGRYKDQQYLVYLDAVEKIIHNIKRFAPDKFRHIQM